LKMKELLSRLNEKNVTVTERMVRHYLELGLLPEPERPSRNQAKYNEEHFKCLLAIDMFKNNGLSLDEIKVKLRELSYYFPQTGQNESLDNHAEAPLNMMNELALEKALIEAEYPQLAQSNHIITKKQAMRDLNCSEETMQEVIRFLGIKNEDYFDTIDYYAVKTCVFYRKAREMSYQLDDTLPELFDQDVPYSFNIERELQETLEAARSIVKNANLNPFLNILLKALIAYTAKEALLNREISDITWEGLNIGWDYKNAL
jgi:DNA-binding transcriptional MerR regulator